jgi:prevent-host-death family protein
MATRTIGAREANQQFSSLLKAIEDDGDTIVITRRGRPVARMIPARQPTDRARIARNIQGILKRYARHSGGGRIDRDALHERGLNT